MNKELPPVIDRDSILKLVDYLLLNAYSTESSGLYHGKMGLSVCLFELARHFEKEAWEEHAFELLLQAVAGADNDVSFENGLSGIGYALFYLQSNAFIEIDMDEIWGEKSQKIESHFQSKIAKKYKTRWTLLVYYLLFRASGPESIADASVYLDFLLDKFIEPFDAIAGSNAGNIVKMKIGSDFCAFLRFIHFVDSRTKIPYNLDKTHALCRLYNELYRSKIMACSFETGYYLELLAGRFNDRHLESSAALQSQKALSGTHYSVMSLKQKLDWLFLLLKDADKNRHHIAGIEDSIFRKKDMTLEQSLFTNLGKNNLHCSFYSGISRLLLYLVFRDAEREEKDYSRFDFLFI